MIRLVINPTELSAKEVAAANLKIIAKLGFLRVMIEASAGWFAANPDKTTTDLYHKLQQLDCSYSIVAQSIDKSTLGVACSLRLPYDMSTEAEYLLVYSYVDNRAIDLRGISEEENLTRVDDAGVIITTAGQDPDYESTARNKGPSVINNTGLINIVKSDLESEFIKSIETTEADGLKTEHVLVGVCNDGSPVFGVKCTKADGSRVFVTSVGYFIGYDGQGAKRMRYCILTDRSTWSGFIADNDRAKAN